MPPYRNILLLIIINAAFANNCIAHSREKQGDTSIFIIGGNRFILDSSGIDTVYIRDPVDNELKMALPTHYDPILINDEKIYKPNEVTTLPVSNIPDMPLDEYLVNKIIKTLNLKVLPNGNMRIYMDMLVIDKSGHLVLYNSDKIKFVGANNIERELPFLDDTLYAALTATPLLKPATLNGNNVNAQLDISLSYFDIMVKNHVITYARRPPELRNAPLKYVEN